MEVYYVNPPRGGTLKVKSKKLGEKLKMKVNDIYKKQVVKRIATAQGHLKKVKKMLEDEEYCLNIIHQSQAVQAALKKVDELVLENHLHTCVLGELKAPLIKKEKLIKEIVEVFEKK